MFVLGIDPGLTTTGYGVVRGSGPAVVAVGAIRTSQREPVEQRLGEIYRDVCGVIEEYEPQVLAIEQVFINQNRATAIGVARASGVVILAAAQHGVIVREFTPTAIKNAVAGYGKASKQQMQKMVAARFGLPVPPEPADAADALATALCYLQTARLEAFT